MLCERRTGVARIDILARDLKIVDGTEPRRFTGTICTMSTSPFSPGLLKGSRALVTGGGTGICRGIALALPRRAWWCARLSLLPANVSEFQAHFTVRGYMLGFLSSSL